MAFLPDAVFQRRLQSEHEQMRKSGFSFSVNPSLTEYEVSLQAAGFARQGGRVFPQNSHRFKFIVKRDYPYAGGLDVIWQTPIFHPNIRESDGKVCIQLVNEWSAAQTLAAVCKAVEHLLENPNPRSPLNIEAARFFDENPDAFKGKYEFKRPKVIVR